jgi:8-oxo-dGTP pyrophosphatase MutT (NUDIX family)
MNLDIDELERRLQGPLPGRAAQFKMAAAARLATLQPDFVVPPTARVACVMLILHRHADSDDWRTVLIRRSSNPHDRHSGQVSFPGGQRDLADASLQTTALREVYEEVGVRPNQLRVLGSLTELYIPVSNFLVHPFVAVAHAPLEFLSQPGEVEEVLTPTLGAFGEPTNRVQRDIVLGEGMTLPDVPCYQIEGRIIWGATAMMLSEFADLVA